MTITNGYCSLPELKSWGFPTITGSADDTNLELAVNSVSRWIDAYCGRRFWKDGSATTRVYETVGLYELDVDDLVSITTLKTDGDGDGIYETTWTAGTDYQLYPLNPLEGPELKPYRAIHAIGSPRFPIAYGYATRRARVQLVALFGWPAVPDSVKQACLIQSAREFQRRKSATGVFGGFDDLGAIRVGTKLDPDVALLLGPYQLHPVVIA